MDLFKLPDLKEKEKKEEEKIVIRNQWGPKKLGRKKPIEKFVAKKISWREDL